MKSETTLAGEALAEARGFDERAFEAALALHRLRTLGEWSGLARSWSVFCSRRLGQPVQLCEALVDNGRRCEVATARTDRPLPENARLLWGIGALGAALERGEGMFAEPGPGASKLSASETLAEAARLREQLAAVRGQAKFEALFGESVGTMARASILREAILDAEG